MSSSQMERISQLEADANTLLHGRIRELRLLIEREGLIIRGQARTYYAKQLAQQMVLEANTGVPILANEIEVL